MSKNGVNENSNFKEMVRVNERQKEFYEIENETEGEGIERDFLSRVWKYFRSQLQSYRSEIGFDDLLTELHRTWMGNLQDKKVLDLGCHTGNPMSVEIASKSASYLGVDLSESAIRKLRKKLHGIDQANAQAVDFLSDDFTEEDFDVVYARSVFHHFEYFEAFLQKLKQHISPGACIITYDPLRTSRLVKTARQVYRPFQTDAEWEFPFDRSSVATISNHFEIVDLQGVLGASKWGFPMYLVYRPLGRSLGKHLKKIDRNQARQVESGLWRCMQVTMHLRHRS